MEDFNCDNCGRSIDQTKEKPYYTRKPTFMRVCIQCYYTLNPDKRKHWTDEVKAFNERVKKRMEK